MRAGGKVRVGGGREGSTDYFLNPPRPDGVGGEVRVTVRCEWVWDGNGCGMRVGGAALRGEKRGPV